MDKEQKNNIKQPSPFFSWKTVKTGFKYVGIGLGIAASIFVLANPPVFLMVMRLSIPLIALGGVGYIGISLVNALTGKRNTNAPVANSKTVSPGTRNNLSRRVIRRRKPEAAFNSNATPANGNVAKQETAPVVKPKDNTL